MQENKHLVVCDEVVALIYQGVLEPRPWQSLTRHLRSRMGADSAAISLRPGNKDVSPLVIWDRLAPLSKERIRLAEQDHARLIDEDPLVAALVRSGDVFTIDDVLPREKLIQTDYYRSLMKAYDIEYQVGMCFSEPGGWSCNIGFMNSAERGQFNDLDKQFLLALLPHLESALTIYARLRHSEIERGIFEDTLDRLGVGVFILDRNGRVTDMNDAARDILRRDDSLSLIREKLVLSSHREEFERAIRAAQKASQGEESINFVDVVRIKHAHQPELGLLVRSVSAGPYRGDKSPAAIVYMSNPMRVKLVPEKLIAQLFGLTETEAKLALLLSNGFTLAEASLELEVTESTVRSYSKSIFAKTGVGRQADLVRIILKSVALLA